VAANRRVWRVLSEIYRDEFPHHPNWKAGQVHPAYLLVSTSLDHVTPGRPRRKLALRGGPRHRLLAVQPGKADLRLDEVGWTLLELDELRSDWDGLSGATHTPYGARRQARHLPRRAPRPRRFFVTSRSSTISAQDRQDCVIRRPEGALVDRP
jgi:hypothetical protein